MQGNGSLESLYACTEGCRNSSYLSFLQDCCVSTLGPNNTNIELYRRTCKEKVTIKGTNKLAMNSLTILWLVFQAQMFYSAV